MLSQIIPLFPNDINTFVDLFGGGFNVGINVETNRVYYNDLNTKVVDILQYFKTHNLKNMLNEIDNLICEYQLSKTNASGYSKLRDYYNKTNQSPLVLYVLICHAFNYQIRFNSKGEYNMPFGKDRSCFNPSLRDKFIAFVSNIQSKQCDFYNLDFSKLKLNKLSNSDFVYCDPPYFNTVATYSENDGWNKEKEDLLKTLLVELDISGIKFALSNNLSVNPALKIWAESNGYNINYLNHTYKNCNYQKKDKCTADMEVLITNYKI